MHVHFFKAWNISLDSRLKCRHASDPAIQTLINLPHQNKHEPTLPFPPKSRFGTKKKHVTSDVEIFGVWPNMFLCLVARY